MDILANLLLLLSSIATCLWLLQQHKQLGHAAHHLVRVFAVCCLFLTADAMGALLLNTAGSDQATLRLMLSNLALYVALPMLASSLVAAARQWFWSMAAWGRWLLGLIAFFELTRRMGHGLLYTQLMLLIASLALVYAGYLAACVRGRLSAVAAGLLILLIGLLASPSPWLAGQPHPALQSLLLALSLPLMGWSLHLQLRRTPPAQ